MRTTKRLPFRSACFGVITSSSPSRVKLAVPPPVPPMLAKRSGELTPTGPQPWVSFTNVRKKTSTGPAGPHMMLFDPSVPLEPGEH